MHILVAILGAAAAIYFYMNRARNAADITSNVLDMANDVRLAARRFGFSRRAGQHPVESVDDPAIARAALGCAFLELDDLPSQDARAALVSQISRTGRIDLKDAEELVILGRWLMTECGGPQPAVARLARRLYKLSGTDGFAPLMEVINGVAKAGSGQLSARQSDALHDLQRAFHL